ncbi:MAG: serine hydrolase domain-containing protein [Bacteroidota bacterium]
MKTLLICLLLLPLLAVTAQEDFTAEIDEIFREMAGPDQPGAAVAVVKDQEIVFAKGYGSANLEYDIPNTPETVFHIASVSKQFTVFSILLLEERGKLSFDDDIRKYIPEVPDFGETITLRHLAAHTSGLRDQWSLLVMAGWRFDDVITKEHILNMVARQKELNFRPGEEYLYCNTGYTLLAEVVARVSGKSFPEFTAENIFRPLGMEQTLFYDDHEKVVKNRAYSYYATGEGGFKKSRLNYANVGATSLFTTVTDLAQWAMNFSSLKVGNQAIIEKMRTPAELNDGTTFGGAYGQFLTPHRGLYQIQHGGSDAGYRTYLARFPEENFSVMVFSNYAQANPNNLALRVADLYLEDAFPPEESSVATTAEKVNYVTLSKKELKKKAGYFWNESGAYVRRIYLRNDTLRYFRGFGNESPLVPVSNQEFKMQGVDVDLRVTFSNNTEPREMIVRIDGGAPIVSQRFEPKDYKEADLLAFAGEYFSPELQTTYHLFVKKGELRLRHYRFGERLLSSQKPDLFVTSGNRVVFERDANGTVTGLRVSTGRVRHLLFEKVGNG